MFYAVINSLSGNQQLSAKAVQQPLQIVVCIVQRQYTPAVDVDGEKLVVTDTPVFALTDEFSQHSERDVLRRDCHLLIAVTLEEIPLAVVLCRKQTFRHRRRQQICKQRLSDVNRND